MLEMTMGNRIRIAVIGAGASGMMSAITAASHGGEVTLYEKNDRVGKKLLATGNGKCNLSNLNFSVDQYYCSDRDKLQEIFQTFSVENLISFFRKCGLMIKSKNGYLYPYAEQASAVLDVLRMELVEKGVKLLADREVSNITFQKERQLFQIKEPDGKCSFYDKVILACGSPASLKKGAGRTGYKLAEGFGHQIKPIMPGLVQLISDELFCKSLAGVRTQVGIRLLADGEELATEFGDLQFTDYGISGIPVLQISRIAGYALRERKDIKVLVDFFPEQDKNEFDELVKTRFKENQKRTLEEFLTGTLNKKINMVLIKQCGCKATMTAKEAGFDKVNEMMQKCRAFPIHISGINSMECAQICAGGVAFEEVNTNLESKLIPGLYLTGEMVDVDGKCGGYNLQWAWTSGYAAGRSAAMDS